MPWLLVQDGVEDVTAAMATVFVWLRYSSARHLTWQRNYNTQPRILGEAQARLTNKIAEVGSTMRRPAADCLGGLLPAAHCPVEVLAATGPVMNAKQEQCRHAGPVQAHGKTGGEAQEWVRSMLSCVGRGGNAQAIRDEILNIMHRNNISEKRGTWMEVRVSAPAAAAGLLHTAPNSLSCSATAAGLPSAGSRVFRRPGRVLRGHQLVCTP